MRKLTAVGIRDENSVRVTSDGERIPFLEQWVRDYVDERKVKNGMKVLVADVADDEDDVQSLEINVECASERAQREDEKVDTINVVEFE